jgi:glycosyltransferase involved in cell wall biosynthesis
VATHLLRPAPPARLVTFIIPAFNEERTITAVIARTAALPLTKEIVVVDDGSDDGTQGILGRQGTAIVNLRLSTNSGRGSAIRAGIHVATGDVVAFLDADLEVSPESYVELVELVREDHADAVIGSRFLSGAAQDMTWAQRNGNRLLTKLANILFKSRLTDVESGTVAIRADLLRQLPLRSAGWDLSIEMVACLVRSGARIVEVPISYSPRSRLGGKKLGWSDFFSAVYFIFKYRSVSS